MAMSRKRDEGKARAPVRDVKAGRRSAGINVAVAVLAATALLILVNILAGAFKARQDVQMVGRYGLSKTARAVLAEVKQPVHLTSIYTSTQRETDPETYLPRVRDVLEEMAQRNSQVTVTNVTSDRQKADVADRLRKRLDAMAADQVAVLKDFQLLSESQAPRLEQMARTWSSYPADGWLSQFGAPKGIEEALNASRESLQQGAQNVRTALNGPGLPDYLELTKDVANALDILKGQLNEITKILAALGELPKSISQSSVKLVAAAKAATATVDDMIKTIEGSPADPAAALAKLSAAADKAAAAAGEVQTQLTALSDASGGFIQASGAWRVASGGTLPGRYGRLAETAANLSERAEGYRQNLKADAQKEVIQQIAAPLAGLKVQAAEFEKGVAELVRSLSTMDPETARILNEVGKPEYFREQTGKISELLAKARPELPPDADEAARKAFDAHQQRRTRLEGQKELIDRIKEDNIVLVEVGEKTGVVTFDEVWPPKPAGPFGPPEEQEQTKRSFYGDMAVAGKMLGLAAEPFGEVVLTMFENVPPQYLWQQSPPIAGPVYSKRLALLRKRLQDANLKVVEWNLFDSPEPPAPTVAGAPRVLLVLPPPPPEPPNPMMPQQRPQWTDQHTDAIRRAVEGGLTPGLPAGAMPAIFLAGWFPQPQAGPLGPPPGPSYVLGDYFRTDWGLDVRSSMRVVRGTPDVNNPQAVKLDVQAWQWLTLSDFTDHAIGKPLQAQRMLWLNVCPITPIADAKVDATVEELLTVPARAADTTWAVRDIEKLITKLYDQKLIVPAGEEGDLKPPFPVAVIARKTVEGNLARAVVIGTSASFVDSYLGEDVIRIQADSSFGYEPPPKIDMDLVVNSAYFLIDKTPFIGAGPSSIQPIELIPDATMTALRVIFGGLLPVAVLAAGLAVWFVRKR